VLSRYQNNDYDTWLKYLDDNTEMMPWQKPKTTGKVIEKYMAEHGT